MADDIHLASIGGGMMGEALIAGLLRADGIVQAANVVVAEPVMERRRLLEQTHGVRTTPHNLEAVANANCVIVAVKPQVFSEVARDLRGKLRPEQLVVTIMAGVPLATVMTGLEHEQTVRVMPNVMCQVNQGVLVWKAASAVTELQRALAQRIFAATGAEFEVHDEAYLDRATAVSASSPAFIFLILEALIDAGVHVGFARPQATTLAVQTVLGAATLLKETGRHPAELKNMVTSPAGTTAEGLLVLERTGVRAALTDAVLAAYHKAEALQKPS